MVKQRSWSASGYNNAVPHRLGDFQVEEFEALWAIDQQCFAPGIAYSRRELAAYIRRKGAFTVVARREASNGNDSAPIVGFIVAEANRRGIGHILSIDVLPEHRREGLGSRLLATAEDRLRAADCRVVVLEAAVDNASALAFYKRHQYSVTKIVPRYYSNGVDALVMAKDLAQPAGPGGCQS